MSQPQSFSNHTKFDPPFHFFLAPLSLIFVIYTIYRLIRIPDLPHAAHLVGALFLLVATFKIRLYSLKVQDRLIRLEETLRLKELMPANLQPRIAELTEDQLIGLRFASDGEVAELARQALDQKLDRKQIKQAVKTWRPDLFRV
jgi:hypothetical protein